jgi:hypothetical protein
MQRSEGISRSLFVTIIIVYGYTDNYRTSSFQKTAGKVGYEGNLLQTY